jgi:4-hydroxy-tetrahydrodipicolinate synthase
VDFQVQNGIDMILPCGTTGEGATLEADEVDRVVRIVMEHAAGRAAVIVGAGSNSTAKAVKAAERAQRLGAAGVLSVGPYYNKPTQEGYYEHFKAVAEVGTPVIIYNVPSRTSGNIEASTILRLAELPNIAGTKESSGNLAQVMQILQHCPAEFRVLSGDDYLALSIITLGGDGVVSVASNEAPGMVRQMVDAALDGDLAQARSMHYKLLPLMNVNFVESNPIPVKAALAMMGVIQENYRLPLVPITSPGREKLRRVLEDIGLLQAAGVPQ